MSFYSAQIIEHASIFAASFLGVGIILGLLGFVDQWRTERTICLTLLMILTINFGYFASYESADSYRMLAPSFFAFTVWIACGASFLSELEYRFFISVKAASRLLLIGIVMGLLLSQFTTRFERSRVTPVTDFVRSSFELFPDNAVVIADWVRFTALLYFQKTHNLRPDLTIIESSADPRHYQHGKIDTHLDYADSVASSRPVFIEHIDDIREDRRFIAKPVSKDWLQIHSMESLCTNAPDNPGSESRRCLDKFDPVFRE